VHSSVLEQRRFDTEATFSKETYSAAVLAEARNMSTFSSIHPPTEVLADGYHSPIPDSPLSSPPDSPLRRLSDLDVFDTKDGTLACPPRIVTATPKSIPFDERATPLVMYSPIDEELENLGIQKGPHLLEMPHDENPLTASTDPGQPPLLRPSWGRPPIVSPREEKKTEALSRSPLPFEDEFADITRLHDEVSVVTPGVDEWRRRVPILLFWRFIRIRIEQPINDDHYDWGLPTTTMMTICKWHRPMKIYRVDMRITALPMLNWPGLDSITKEKRRRGKTSQPMNPCSIDPNGLLMAKKRRRKKKTFGR
jgi:hypothetical protein